MQGAKRKHGGKKGETEIQAAQCPVAGGEQFPQSDECSTQQDGTFPKTGGTFPNLGGTFP